MIHRIIFTFGVRDFALRLGTVAFKSSSGGLFGNSNRQEKTLLLPVTHRHRKLTLHPYKGAELLRRGHHRVPEPTTEEFKGHFDLIIVPGVCFDEKGNRLGRGGGYYDSFLKQHADVHKVGVCFDTQLRKHKEVPHHHFDKPVDVVVTSNRTIGE